MDIVIVSLLLGFSFSNLQHVCQADLDLGLIIEGSSSIRNANPADGSSDNWNILLSFAANITDRLPESGTQVGAVLFYDRGELLFRLDQYTDLAEAKHAILNTRYPGGARNTSGGLFIAQTQLFNVNNGDRSTVPNLAIVITVGKSTLDREKTLPYAEDLRGDGVDIVSVGITSSADEVELRGLSSPPQLRGRNYFRSSYKDLTGLIDRILINAFK